MRLQLSFSRWLKYAIGICLIFLLCLNYFQSAAEKLKNESLGSAAKRNGSSFRREVSRKVVSKGPTNLERTFGNWPNLSRNSEVKKSFSHIKKSSNLPRKASRKQTLQRSIKNRRSKSDNKTFYTQESYQKWDIPLSKMIRRESHAFYDNGATDLSYSWAIKLPNSNKSSSNNTDLHLLASQIAEEHNLINYGPIGGLAGYFYFVHSNFFNDSLGDINNFGRHMFKANITHTLTRHPNIEWVKHEVIRMRKKRALEFKDQFFPSQWHLVNLKFVNHDINVTGVWELNITGRGVVVSVIDDGVEWTNPDILDNYSSEGSWDLNSNDGDPMPRADEAGLNHHGTRCAGEIAAVANEYCAVGVAYEARVSGVRILDGPMTDSLEAMAFNTKMEVNDVYSCSWGPDDNGKTVDGPHQLAQAALAHGVMAGRKGYGSIYVVASGNGGHFKDNCNFDGYANSIFTVTIGAVDELGQMPYYAEHCAAMLAVTYSSGQGHQRNIVTTDWRLGSGTGCTDRHTGTSAAAPLAAGMIALMLQVRYCLTWRDIQHLIVFTAVKVAIDEEEWHTNAAGFKHSHKHGFGLLNSWRLVTTAKLWESVPYMTSWSSPKLIVNEKIPAAGQLERIFTVTNKMAEEVTTLEHVTVTVNIGHYCRGNIVVSLVSPAGTVSKLSTPRKYDRSSDGFNDWTFSTVRCWGERSQGTWKIHIADTGGGVRRGKLKSWRLTFYGSLMTAKEIIKRRRLVKQAVSGNFFSQPGPPCSPPPSPYVEKIAVSSRMLKILLLLSGFFFLVCMYFLMETLFDQEGKYPTIDLNESDLNSPDGFDIKNFLPEELTVHDQVRLNILLEGGNGKPAKSLLSTSTDEAVLNEIKLSSEKANKPTSITITLTPDELTKTKEFEDRLKLALEQSKLLQIQQMNQIKNLENEISQADKDEGLGIIDAVSERQKPKKSKKLKGILKKPKESRD